MSEIIQRRKLYEDVLDRLMARIRAGEFAPGAHLPSERELMETYGVGRPAVREALQAMERSGIVEIIHGERARVVVPTAKGLIDQIAGGAAHLLRSQPDMLKHLKEARVFLETNIARKAAECATDEQMVLLQQKVQDQRDAISNLPEFILRDMEFHRTIAEISGNPIFPAIVQSLFLWANEFYQPMVRAPGVEELTLSEHQSIVDAICKHDGDAAADAMAAHLNRANDLYRRVEMT
jgi:DNA-binding FadR family transcriptional regulator